MRFVAIDVETANSYKGSICQIGLAWVRDGRIVTTWSSLVRPTGPRCEFDPDTIEVHGILPEQVQDSPTFAELWPEIHARIADNVLVAHNANFDMAALKAVLADSGIPCPALPVVCSLVLARRRYDLPSHTLDVCCAEAGVELTQHHEATADALAAAGITLHMGTLVGAESLDELLEASGVAAGRLSESGYTSCHVNGPNVGLVEPSLF